MICSLHCCPQDPKKYDPSCKAGWIGRILLPHARATALVDPSRFLIPARQTTTGRQVTVVLDIDETLVYARQKPILYRPYLKEFLQVAKGRKCHELKDKGCSFSSEKERCRQLRSTTGGHRCILLCNAALMGFHNPAINSTIVTSNNPYHRLCQRKTKETKPMAQTEQRWMAIQHSDTAPLPAPAEVSQSVP